MCEGLCPPKWSTAFPSLYLFKRRGFLSPLVSLELPFVEAVGWRGEAEAASVLSCQAGLPLPAHPTACLPPNSLWPLSSLQLKGSTGVPSLVSCPGWVATDAGLRTWATSLRSPRESCRPALGPLETFLAKKVLSSGGGAKTKALSYACFLIYMHNPVRPWPVLRAREASQMSRSSLPSCRIVL